MINNQNKHNKQRLYIALSGIPAIFCSFFLPPKKGRIILNSHFNTKFDFNSKFLFLYLLDKGYDVWFVINDDTYRNKLINEYGNHFIETESFLGKIFALRSRVWFISAFELPVGGIFLKLNRRIIHLTHGSLIKNVGLLEKDISFLKRMYYFFFVRTNISYSIATSDFFVPSTAGYIGINQKKILITGFPRNDALWNSNLTCPKLLSNCGFTVLYAPTWRKNSNVRLFPFDDLNFNELNEFLESENITIFIRLHPNDEENFDQRILGNRIKSFFSNEYNEIMDFLKYFDSLITDYSSIAYDFLLLNRPMIFLPYDYDEYCSQIGFAVNYKTIAAGFIPRNFVEFKQALLDIKNKDSFKERRTKIMDLCNKYRENNCERLINTLKQKHIKGLDL